LDINSQEIKSLRQSKGWTQQHLADACDLSLRTIQRVERHGAASNETALSLCAVFDRTIEQLIVIEVLETTEAKQVSIYAMLPVFAVGGIIGGIIMKLIS
jgi:transcriptional regulator with XRE-family HTH domain